MSKEEIRSALERLHAALDDAPPLDEDLRLLLVEVDADIHQALHRQGPAPEGAPPLGARIDSLAARLAIEHPAAERFLRELIDALGRMGV